MISLLQRNKKILPLNTREELAQKINQQLCSPPLDEKEFKKQWKGALKYTERNNQRSGYTIDKNNNPNSIEDGENTTTNLIKPIAEKLLNLTKENCELFKDQYGTAHVIVKINNHYEVLSVEGNRFKRYLSKLYYDNCNNKIANTEAISNVYSSATSSKCRI